MTEGFSTFLEYYNKTREVNLLESPLLRKRYMGGPLDDSLGNAAYAKEIVDTEEAKEKITILSTSLSIHSTQYDTNPVKIVDRFITLDPWIAVEFVYSLVNNGLKMGGVWQRPQFVSLARTIFFDYYLPKYEFIESDHIYSEEGKEYWKKLITTAK